MRTRRIVLAGLLVLISLTLWDRPAVPSLAGTAGRPVCDRAQFAQADALKGPVSFHGLPPVELGADLDWRMDPHRNRSWMLSLHALRWMGRLIVEYERTGDGAYLERAKRITRDWVEDNPRGGSGTSEWAWAEHAVALRAPTLVCLSEHVRDGWLAESMAEHARVLSDPSLYRAGHNHGLDQDIALLSLGCRLDVAGWRDLALRRMTSSAELAIDGQGALAEQAPRYGVYVHQRLGVAFTAARRCGLALPAGLRARRTALETYIAHATRPDGRLVPLGDSPADLRPTGFPRPSSPVGVFTGGYVFGRGGWGPKAAYYSIRFGPGRRLHGHEDHLGLTYRAGGQDLLVEAGFHSYEKSPYVAWTATPEAHNVPLVEGERFRPGTATRLVRSRIQPVRQAYELTDDAFGVSRTRKVLVHHGPDAMAVLDSAGGGRRIRTVWHLAPGAQLTLVQFEMPGCVPAAPPARKVGRISTGYLKTAESTTLTSPPARSLLTVIVPGRARVTCDGAKIRVGANLTIPADLG
ncbi:heparinase II/III family protein [Nonomuraea sp. NPDC050328]|uniref:heparinase II/III family protein n=1 Tax=Nonomuraea sp. NPDC050328 TaxID=3364361 RepID=UPI0037B0F8CA